MKRIETGATAGGGIDAAIEQEFGDVRAAEETGAGQRFREDIIVETVDPLEDATVEQRLEAREVAVTETSDSVVEYAQILHSSINDATSAVHPVWCDAPSPSPVSP